MKCSGGVLLVALLVSVAAPAQQESKQAANPVTDTVRQLLARQSKNLIAAVEEMPAEKYNFHPTPAQMTFAHLVMHMAGSNNFLCSNISGTPAPEEAKLSESDPKGKLVQALKSSFDYCTSALARLDDSRLGDTVQFFGRRRVSRAAALIALTNDFADHYAIAAVYLRLNGLLPPTAKKPGKE